MHVVNDLPLCTVVGFSDLPIPKFKVGKYGGILLKHLQHFRWLMEWFRRGYTHIQHTDIQPEIQKLVGSRVAT